MSIYAALDGVMGEQVASNRGWGDFGRWVDTLDAARYGQVVHLREYGWSQRLPELQTQLSAALSAAPPNPDVASSAAMIVDILRNRGGTEVLTITGGLGPDDAETFCGGPGSGVPGPCAGPDVERSRSGWLARAKELPRELATKAAAKVKEKFGQLEARYGRKYAVAIMGAGLAGVPIPLPGASLVTAAPVIAIAELHRALSARAHEELDQFEELTPEQIEALGKQFVAELLADWKG